MAPVSVDFVTAFLSGSNRRVDFQNIGFSGEETVIPEPRTAMLLGLELELELADLASRRR